MMELNEQKHTEWKKTNKLKCDNVEDTTLPVVLQIYICNSKQA